MNDTIITLLGSGPIALLVIMLVTGMGTMGMVIRAMWLHIIALQKELGEVRSECNRELRESLSKVDASMGSFERAVTSLAAVMQDRGRNGR